MLKFDRSGGMGTEQVRGRKAGNSQPQIRAWGLKTEEGKGRASLSGGARAALGSAIFLYSCAGVFTVREASAGGIPPVGHSSSPGTKLHPLG